MALRWLLLAGVAAVAAPATASIPKDMIESSKIQAGRATSQSLEIRVPCLTDGTCKGVWLDYKGVNGSQSTVRLDIQKETVITLSNLQSNSEYEVKVSFQFNNTSFEGYSRVRTCPKEVPILKGLRFAKTGPGWLDVRWLPVKDERCHSNIYYLVRYEVTGTDKVTNWMSYGVFNKSNGGDEVFRPTHPCAGWDSEFCLLLTDEVVPGANHTVQVKPVRYNRLQWPSGEGSDVGAMAPPITMVADARASGEYALGGSDALTPCVPRVTTPANSREGRGRSLAQEPVVVPIWAIVLACVLLVVALVIFVVARWRQRVASRKQLLSDDSSPHSDPHAFRSSSVYDDCVSTMHGQTLPPLGPEPLQGRLKGMQGAPEKQLQGLQALAAAAAAKVSGEAEPVPVSNHYVAMASQPIYDDAQSLVRSAPPQHTYSNTPGEPSRESNLYIEPGSPIYEDAKGLDERASSGYNRPYSQAKAGPWRAW